MNDKNVLCQVSVKHTGYTPGPQHPTHEAGTLTCSCGYNAAEENERLKALLTDALSYVDSECVFPRSLESEIREALK